MTRPERGPAGASVHQPRSLLSGGLRPAWLVVAGALVLGFTAVLALPRSAALAQESTEPASTDVTVTDVTVTEEPGPCSNLGAFCERLLEWTGSEVFAETTAWVLGTPLKIAVIVGLAVVANRLARRAIRASANRLLKFDLPDNLVSQRTAERAHQRADAVGTMLRSTASALIFGIAAIAILDTLGVSVVPILASLGIAGIAIGFGAQKLIEDLISGVMLVVEDQLGVGDRVDVGHVEGVVERLTLRSTVILARNGVRWYVPNSEISRVANESQHKSRASVQIGVAYDTDLQAAVATLHQAVVTMTEEEHWQEAAPEDISEPFVAQLGDDAIVLELRLFVVPTQRRAFERALRQRLIAVAAESGIVLPNPELDVNVSTGAPKGRSRRLVGQVQ